MSEKTVMMVVCDVHPKDHPATHFKVEVDLCDTAFKMIQAKQQGTVPYPCPQCGRGFRSKGGLTKHLTDTHGAEPSTQRARDRRNGNGEQVA